MKKIIAAVLILFLALSLTACAGKAYEITTKSGKTYTALGALEYDVQTETYTFENEQGNQVILNQEEVEVIQEKN